MSIANKILARMGALSKTAGFTGRVDLDITDYQGLGDGKNAGHVVIRHDPSLPAPTCAELEAYFERSFGNGVRANLDTVRIHKEQSAVSLIANLQQYTRPITDADGPSMSRLNPLTYVDANTQEVWDVQSDEAGQRYMVRQSSDNLAEIIEARRLRSRTAPKMATLKVSTLDVGVGDRVSFYDNGLLAYGEVEDLDGQTIAIAAVTGTVRVPKDAVTKVISRGVKTSSDDKVSLRKYFSEAFGDAAYAAELTEKTSDDK